MAGVITFQGAIMTFKDDVPAFTLDLECYEGGGTYEDIGLTSQGNKVAEAIPIIDRGVNKQWVDGVNFIGNATFEFTYQTLLGVSDPAATPIDAFTRRGAWVAAVSTTTNGSYTIDIDIFQPTREGKTTGEILQFKGCKLNAAPTITEGNPNKISFSFQYLDFDITPET